MARVIVVKYLYQTNNKPARLKVSEYYLGKSKIYPVYTDENLNLDKRIAQVRDQFIKDMGLNWNCEWVSGDLKSGETVFVANGSRKD